MKYIEPVKSVVLFLLVMLSVVLTFIIWTYTPDYKVIEQTEGKEILIGTQKKVEDVIKPYKAIYSSDDDLTGTVSNGAMKDIMNIFEGWNILDLVRVNNNISPTYINEMIRANHRMTVFFAGEIPFSELGTIFNFDEKELPETTFNRIIIDWSNYSNKEVQMYFVSSSNKSLLRSHVSITNANEFVKDIIEPSKLQSAYKEVERDGYTSLYVPSDKIESVKYTYYMNELSPELFKNVLFSEPNVVQRNVESATFEKYTDGLSLMTVDTRSKSLTYVYPAAESSIRIEPSKLFKDSFDFINEHGGFTADYRYVSSNPSKNQIDYQLYLQGFPVYSDQATTRITTVWGDNRIFRYRRPYFSLDISEKEIKELPSGTEIVEKIHKLNNIVLSDIDEIAVGYYLTQDENLRLFTLEPSWFIIRNGSWILVTPEMLGGVKNGLE
ncbi:two-component system activity regulator YycH [Micromonospora provocatoris]|uniref:YycH family regulatory protein n=1 Tax=Bacillati TaxID=1783272 RepID=UPI0011245916|nr:two-component system activity regulator YycH [Lysinibacillus sp. CD3-6]QPQ33727.1 two-component system regulatory protein YycI [Lysinibacillus sp. JNUCC-52]UED80335.1 two-component system activity regulator YycH [Lysinibacillus sp. CD3-6]